MSIIHFASAIAVAGGALPDIALSNRDLSDTSTHPTQPITTLSFSNGGIFRAIEGGDTTVVPGQWAVNPAADIGTQFEIRFRLLSNSGGTISGSALNTWLPLASDRSLSFTRATVGSAAGSVAVDIGAVGTSTTLNSATFTLSATRNALVAGSWPIQDSDSETSGSAQAGITFNTNGTGVTFAESIAFNWASPTTTNIGAQYEINVTLTGGTATVSGPTTGANVWHNLGSSRTWAVSRSTNGTSSRVLTVRIRRVGTTTVLAQQSINLIAVFGTPP